jgi:hypothetical protein
MRKTASPLIVIIFIISLTLIVSAQTDDNLWKDELNYSNVAQFEAAGWTSEHFSGVSIGSSGIIVDGTIRGTTINYNGHFASGIHNWKVESKGKWIGGAHSGTVVSVSTDKRNYVFQADGCYCQFAFYRDNQKVWTSEKGTYNENKDTFETVSMAKSEAQIKCYLNEKLEYTYTETDSTSSELTGVNFSSPTEGITEYDYFTVNGDISIRTSGTIQSDSILSNPIFLGGLVGGVCVGVGVILYYFFVAGRNRATF